MADEENNNEEENQEGENEEESEEEEQEENEQEEESEEDTEDAEGAEDEDDQEEDAEEEDDDDNEVEEEGEDVEVPEKFEDIVEEIEGMPVIELNELVKLLEKKWGVSAQAVAAGGGGEEEEEEKDEYDVELADFGDSKISVIKAVKAALGLGLKEAKGMVEDAPVVLKEGVPTEEAEEMKEKIEDEGGEVELK